LFDTRADDIFYFNKGRLYANYLLMRELGADFESVIREKGLTNAWNGTVETFRIAAELDPWIVWNGYPDGLLIPNHLAAQGFYLLRARTQLREIKQHPAEIGRRGGDLPTHRRALDERVRGCWAGRRRRPARRHVSASAAASSPRRLADFRRHSAGGGSRQPGQSGDRHSVSSLQVQWRRGNVDFRMGLILLLGGLFGSTAGIWLFTLPQAHGQVDFVIAVAYVVMLSTIGVLMLVESLRTYVKRRRNPQAPRGKLHTHYLVHRLPLKLRFYKSKLYISALLPIGIGFVIGVLSAILGVGGGFVLVPAMIYILGMRRRGDRHVELPDPFVAANVTFLAGRRPTARSISCWRCADPGRVVGRSRSLTGLAASLPGVVLRGLMSILILASRPSLDRAAAHAEFAVLAGTARSRRRRPGSPTARR